MSCLEWETATVGNKRVIIIIIIYLSSANTNANDSPRPRVKREKNATRWLDGMDYKRFGRIWPWKRDRGRKKLVLACLLVWCFSSLWSNVAGIQLFLVVCLFGSNICCVFIRPDYLTNRQVDRQTHATKTSYHFLRVWMHHENPIPCKIFKNEIWRMRVSQKRKTWAKARERKKVLLTFKDFAYCEWR